MKVTNQQLFNSIIPLRELATTKLPAKTSYRLSKIIRKVDQLNKLIEAAKMEVCKKYAVKDENGEVKIVDNQASFPPEAVVLANKELDELMSVENEIDLEQIKVDDLGTVEIPAQYFALLDWLFT